ncbi:MAG: bifunctional hydroxymethylpyrimidine kinase/phosphomethylpyrimidine kinase, partial [Bacteroidota bacterium]
MDHPFDRPIVLSIGGHDPSGGAGLNADLKTFEQFRVYGLSVCTALTVQNGEQFEAIKWTAPQLIGDQIDILARKFQPVTAKVGIIENLDVLEQVVNRLKAHWPKLKIVWDPVLKASAGFVFHDSQPKENFQ